MSKDEGLDDVTQRVLGVGLPSFAYNKNGKASRSAGARKLFSGLFVLGFFGLVLFGYFALESRVDLLIFLGVFLWSMLAALFSWAMRKIDP